MTDKRSSEPPEYSDRGPIDTDWMTDDHLRHIADVLASLNAAEKIAEDNRWQIAFCGTVEVVTGGDDVTDGHLVGWLKPIDFPGAWSFIPRTPHGIWDQESNRWVDINLRTVEPLPVASEHAGRSGTATNTQ